VPEHVRELMAKKLAVNVVDKTIEVLKELDKLKKNVQELMGDKEFMSFVESIYLKADERTVRKTISDITYYLKIYAMLYRPYIEEAWSDFEQDN
jgi:alpha-N-acetylglucosamine transferase